jgi:uncharacterized protein (DUF433 family)
MVRLPLTPLAPPLRVDAAGVVRVGSTRVTLETLVASYRDGSMAEEIVQQYPAMELADVHAVIAYYLKHRPEVEAYLQHRERGAEETRARVEDVCDQRGVRERLLARQTAKKKIA